MLTNSMYNQIERSISGSRWLDFGQACMYGVTKSNNGKILLRSHSVVSFPEINHICMSRRSILINSFGYNVKHVSINLIMN